MKFTLVWILGALSFSGSAAESSATALKLSVSHLGSPICGAHSELELGQMYNFCEGHSGDKKLLVRARMDRNGLHTVKVSTRIEAIDPAGKITLLSSAAIVTLYGEPASISQSSDQGEELLKIEVLALPLLN